MWRLLLFFCFSLFYLLDKTCFEMAESFKKTHIKTSLQTGSSQHLAQCHAEHITDRRWSAQTPGWDWTSCSALLSPPQTTPPRTPDCAPATGETNRTKMIKRTKEFIFIF